MAIFLKGCKQYYNFGSRNSLMLSFTNIWDLLCWLWIFPWIKLSWNSCSMWEKTGSFWQYHCEELFSFNLKGFYDSYVVWSRRLFEERIPFARDLSLENSADSCLCFWLGLLHSVSYFFFLYWLPSWFLCTVFDSIFFPYFSKWYTQVY